MWVNGSRTFMTRTPIENRRTGIRGGQSKASSASFVEGPGGKPSATCVPPSDFRQSRGGMILPSGFVVPKTLKPMRRPTSRAGDAGNTIQSHLSLRGIVRCQYAAYRDSSRDEFHTI